MTPKRLYCLLLATVGLSSVLLIVAAYNVSGLFKQKSSELATAKAQVDQLTNQQASLVKAKKDVTRYADLEKITKAVVPQDKDQAQAVREITNIAAANNVSLTTITFPSSNLGTTAGGSKAAAAAATRATPNLSQLTKVPAIPGVYNLQITIGNNTSSPVSFTQLDALLRGLENNRRTAAVSSLSIQPQANNANRLVFTLIINTYIKPS